MPKPRRPRPRLFSRHLRVAALLFVLFPVSGCGILSPEDDPRTTPREGETTVLFVGSSYLAYHSVPDRFRDFSRKAGREVFVRYHLALGQPLSFFAADPSTLDAIRSLDWDFVVLQGGAQTAAYPRLGGTSDYLALQELRRIATEDSPETTVVYMLPWAFEDGMTWMEGHTETYEVMQLDIRANALEWADELGLVLSPVGMAWHRVLTTWTHGPHFLHDADWHHANELGAYLTAATFFSTIWQEDATEVGYRWKIESDLARDLRGVAGATVLDSLALWNLAR